MDFLFHNISEKEKEEIKKQVDSILKSFSEKLSEIDRDVGEFSVERKEFERSEDGRLQTANRKFAVPHRNAETGNQPFIRQSQMKPLELDRKIMFENAPEKNDDFIVGEKKKW